jgi:hypothetical protein
MESEYAEDEKSLQRAKNEPNPVNTKKWNTKTILGVVPAAF